MSEKICIEMIQASMDSETFLAKQHGASIE